MNKILRASKAGFPCNRNLWYSVNGTKGIINPRTQKIFDVGTCLEPLIVEWLRKDGWTVEYNPGSQNAALSFEIPVVTGGMISGHPDCFISKPNGYGHVLADIKTMNDASFRRWKREGTLKDKPQYVDQLTIYAMGAGVWAGIKVDKLAVVGVNKNTSDMHIDFFDLDTDRFHKIRRRAIDIFLADKAPEENCPAESWCCKYCEYNHLCEIFAESQGDTAIGDDMAVTDDTDVINAVDLLREARELSKAGKELEDEAKIVLDEKIRQQGIKSVKAGDLILSLSERTSKKFDSKRFQIDEPELYIVYQKPSTSVTYTIKEAS